MSDNGILEIVTAADRGDLDAIDEFIATVSMSGDLFENPGIVEKCDEYLKTLAAAGRPEGFILIGDNYLNGRNIEKDIHKALDYFELASEAGETFGYEIIAELHIKGKDLPVNYEKAYEYLRQSAQANNGELRSDSGNYFMGELYYFGLGVTKDLNEAKRYYRRNVEDCDDNTSDYYWKSCARLKAIYEEIGKTDYDKYIKKLGRVVKKHTTGMTEDEIALMLGVYENQ